MGEPYIWLTNNSLQKFRYLELSGSTDSSGNGLSGFEWAYRIKAVCLRLRLLNTRTHPSRIFCTRSMPAYRSRYHHTHTHTQGSLHTWQLWFLTGCAAAAIFGKKWAETTDRRPWQQEVGQGYVTSDCFWCCTPVKWFLLDSVALKLLAKWKQKNDNNSYRHDTFIKF